MSVDPVISFVLLTYNQEAFVRTAVRSALAQTYRPLEIIVSDDCSQDATFDVVRREVAEYNGPHRVVLNRNDHNMGLASHINRAVSLATGEFLVMAAGDDISSPERAAMLAERWRDPHAPVDLVCSYFEEIDSHGERTGFVKRDVVFVPDLAQNVQRWRCGATGACAGYSRRLCAKYGELDERVVSEDWVMSFRAWLEGGIGLVEAPLVQHRTHGASLSVENRGVRRQGDATRRAFLRRRSAGDRAARAAHWVDAWSLMPKSTSPSIGRQLQRWASALECEWAAYNSTRLGALKMACRAVLGSRAPSSCTRILIRNVVGWQ